MFTLKVDFKNREHHIPFNPGISVKEILDESDIRVRSDCGGIGACGLCLVRIISGNVSKPTDKEVYSISSTQILERFRLACQVKPLQNVKISVESLTQKCLWKDYSAEEFTSDGFLSFKINTLPCKYQFGIAVDLGTTQMRLSLWDMQKKVRLARLSCINPQAVYGSDVLTRLTAASKSNKQALEISNVIKDAIKDALQYLHSHKSYNIQEIGNIVIVGNTAMLALFTGKNYEMMLNTETWLSFIDCSLKETKSLCQLWGLNEETSIEIMEPLGGFVGSDLLAGVLATGLTENSGGILLIDFGTNSEMALFDGSVVWVTSAAGGPAFEGSGISCGMPAEPGAIYKIEDSEVSSGLDYKVIGDYEAKGLCGSGLVDIIAYLIREKIVNKAGLFKRDMRDKGFVILEGKNEIILKKQDIDVFQRAKAAIGAGVISLLEKAGMGLKDLEHIYICGAFGRYLNKKNGQKIGLLPVIEPQKIELCGNTSLAGCELLLFSQEKQKIIRLLKERARLINMSQVPRFEESFINNLYLQNIKME